jgi:hypothetical protein
MLEREDSRGLPPQRDFVIYCLFNINDISIEGFQTVLDQRLDLARDPMIRMAMRVKKGRTSMEDFQRAVTS